MDFEYNLSLPAVVSGHLFGVRSSWIDLTHGLVTGLANTPEHMHEQIITIYYQGVLHAS